MSILIFTHVFTFIFLFFLLLFFYFPLSRVVSCSALSATTQLGIGAFRRAGGTALDGSVCAPIGRDRTKRWLRVDSRVREWQTERPQREEDAARSPHRPLGSHGRFGDRSTVTSNERKVESNAPEMNTLQT